MRSAINMALICAALNLVKANGLRSNKLYFWHLIRFSNSVDNGFRHPIGHFCIAMQNDHTGVYFRANIHIMIKVEHRRKESPMRSFACLMILFFSLATAVASPQEEARPMPDSRIREAIELMTGFAERTGLSSERPQQRYLWTDGFAVCNGCRPGCDSRHHNLIIFS